LILDQDAERRLVKGGVIGFDNLGTLDPAEIFAQKEPDEPLRVDAVLNPDQAVKAEIVKLVELRERQ
jgi:hypothetical protein